MGTKVARKKRRRKRVDSICLVCKFMKGHFAFIRLSSEETGKNQEQALWCLQGELYSYPSTVTGLTLFVNSQNLVSIAINIKSD